MQALCRECGHLRTVSSNYHFGANDVNRCTGYFQDSRGWTQTGTFEVHRMQSAHAARTHS
jgi:hypothetical protein